MGNLWTLQDAKNKFSAVVEAAQNGKPQRVTKRGVEAVVVLSTADYERLVALDVKADDDFLNHLLNAPKLPDDCQNLFDREDPFELQGREIDFRD
ncbi:type II toxin-antitoxin system Phd/YefM family antitoxin [Aureimonas leprariae]|uniref:Antitoxin n=1 Tax=Plantimonas leprariae TaxID=2615207 RepID=A0A7V7PKT7_9HYPH|nr:type II toxin-antitoxin system Phd/YefM family antitoxin [Aureimonas leprariae]KAB0676430.1 type II toxin-antitoxin system Phd/YefM family antitoxin [Aureimonas leprariae]